MSAVPDNDRTGPRPGTTGRALVPFTPSTARSFAWPTLRQGMLIVGLGLALGVGVAGFHGARHVALAWMGPAQPDPQDALLHRLQDEVGRLQSSVDALRSVADATKPDEPLRGLKRSVEALKQDVDQVRTSGSASVAQLAAKIDKADHDPSSKLAEIAARLERMERTAAAQAADPQPQKVADRGGRLDRIEKPAASNPTPLPTAPPKTPAVPPARTAATAVLPTGTLKSNAAPARTEVTQVAATDPKAVPPKPPTVGGWVVRDVYDGVALVEARSGGMREVGPGEFLPGAGEIRSIERHGRTWVVLTSRGVIDSATF